MHHDTLKKEFLFFDLNIAEQRKLMKVVRQTIMSIQSLGFQLVGLEQNHNNVDDIVEDPSHDDASFSATSFN